MWQPIVIAGMMIMYLLAIRHGYIISRYQASTVYRIRPHNCPRCGSPINPVARYCRICGQLLTV